MNYQYPPQTPILAVLILSFAPVVAAEAAERPWSPDKLSPTLQVDTGPRSAPLDVIVKYRRPPGALQRALVRRVGGVIKKTPLGSRWVSMRLPKGAVKALTISPEVEFVAYDAPLTASLDVARELVRVPTAPLPESALRGAGITIAMLDSGVAAHPEIQTLLAAAEFLSHPGAESIWGVVGVVGGEFPSDDPAFSIDLHGHGTHVAGILVGNGSATQGRTAGFAPEAGLVSVRVLDAEGRGRTSDAIAGLQWIIDNKDRFGIRVLNLSIGHPVYEPAHLDPLVEAVEAVWDAGIVVVCSAGNGGRNGHGTVSSPCNSRKVITVGAINDRNTGASGDDLVATFSSRGPTRADLVAKPDLVAPGNRIVSARAPGSTLDVAFPGRRVAADPARPGLLEHFEMSGTSMAAPMVAATAALMLEQEPWLTPATVKARLMLSARKPLGNPLITGAGVLDTLAALRTGGSVPRSPSPLVLRDPVTGRLAFENTGVLWMNPAFSLTSLWSNTVLWSEGADPTDPILWSYGLLESGGSLWPDGALWPDSTLWPDTDVWRDATLWPDTDSSEGQPDQDGTLWPDDGDDDDGDDDDDDDRPPGFTGIQTWRSLPVSP